MPYGFSGLAANYYLQRIEASLKSAASVHSRYPFDGCGSGAVSPPAVCPGGNQRPPYTAEGGGHTTGAGNTGNIVVTQSVYHELSGMIKEIDDKISSELAAISREIDDMCGSVYMLPSTTPRVLEIMERVRSSIPEFKGVSDDAGMDARGFAGEMLSIR
jgi:hypothetical protein